MELLSGEVVPFVVAPEYQHVGNVVQHNGADEIDVARRKLLAEHMFAPLHKQVLFNPQLAFHEKRTLVLSMVGRKLLHGSGHWALRSAKEARMFKAGYMHHWRKCGRPLLGVSFAEVNDEKVCAM